MSENPFLALIIVFAPLSLLAIGGASAIYAPLQHQAVDVHQWVSGREYLELFAIARVTPGPGSMLATLVGWRVAGLPGALVATLSLYIPCSVLCFGAAHTWNRYRGTRWHSAIENGLRPIAAGLMAAGGAALLRIEDTGPFAWGLALAATAILIWRPLLHPMILMAAGAAIFVAVHAFM
jgi:chromate transporter